MSVPSFHSTAVSTLAALLVVYSAAAIATETSKGTRSIIVRERLPTPKSAPPPATAPLNVTQPPAASTDQASPDLGTAGGANVRRSDDTSTAVPTVPPGYPSPDSKVAAPAAPVGSGA